MTLQQIADTLNKELDFPHQSIHTHKLLNEVVWIQVSKQPKSEWPHGYLENSDYVKFIIQQNNDGLYAYESGVIRSVKKPVSGERITKTIIKELKKWETKQ